MLFASNECRPRMVLNMFYLLIACRTVKMDIHSANRRVNTSNVFGYIRGSVEPGTTSTHYLLEIQVAYSNRIVQENLYCEKRYISASYSSLILEFISSHVIQK